MKNLIKFFWLLAFLLTFSACTEEISEEVKNGTNLTSEQQELAKFENKYIKLVNTSDPNLKYIMHKSGSMNEPCQLKSPRLGFSSLSYQNDSGVYTTDCILDTKEYDLYYSGASFEIQVDDNLCEYVAYRPYRFFQYAPGNSAIVQHEVTCDAVCESTYPGICNQKFKSVTGPLTTGDLVGSDITAFSDSIGNPLQCEFDYSKRVLNPGPNCDQGIITTYRYSITSGLNGAAEPEPTCTISGANSEAPQFAVLSSTFETCGGKHEACLAGPGAEILDPKERQKIYQNLELDYFSQNYDLTPPFSKGYKSNISIANFSRTFADTSATKQSTTPSTLFDVLEGVNSVKGFEIENFMAENRYNPFFTTTPGNQFATYGRNLFEDPSGKRTQPYYGFYCLDKARDIKAQIRLFIREWDRDYEPNNRYIAKISDIHISYPNVINPANPALMDAVGEQFTANDDWNDFWDLDDLLTDIDGDLENSIDGDAILFDNPFDSGIFGNLQYGACWNGSALTNAYRTQKLCEANGTCIGNAAFNNNKPGCVAAGFFWFSNYQWRYQSYCDGGLNGRVDATSTICTGNGGTWKTVNKSDLYPGSGL